MGTLIAYGSIYISPAVFKYSAGLSILIPFFLALNTLILLYYLIRLSKRVIIPLALLLLGLPFFKVSIAIHAPIEATGDFSLISYNVKWFNQERGKSIHDISALTEALSPDIMCMQEYYHTWPNFDKLNISGDYELTLIEPSFNLVILSRYKVLNKGLLFENKNRNNILFADMAIKAGDTIRIYNVHLESMGINTSNLQDTEGIREDYEEVKTKFLDGAAIRADQIEILLDHVATSPYPVLIVGDFNDVPYSHNYFRLRERFDNAFEKAGRGLGVTYNGKLPFLRIDHQFFGEGLQIESFNTIDHVNFSDHFPVLGIYSLSE